MVSGVAERLNAPTGGDDKYAAEIVISVGSNPTTGANLKTEL